MEKHKTCPCALCRLRKQERTWPRTVTDKIDVMRLNFPHNTTSAADEQFKKHFNEKSLIELASIILRLEIGHAATHSNYCEQLFAEYLRKAGWAQRAHDQFLRKQKK